MASFVQPVGGDTIAAECEDSRFRVYCSSILPANERFAILFQFINFTLGITAIAVPLVLFLIYYYLQYRKLQSRKIPTQVFLVPKPHDASLTSIPEPAQDGAIQMPPQLIMDFP